MNTQEYIQMNRRIHERTPVNFHVRVTVLANPAINASGDAVDISRAGMCVHLPIRIPPGSFVQLNIADTVLFGVIAYAREWSLSEPFFARDKIFIEPVKASDAVEDGTERMNYRTGIEVDEASIGTSGLSQLLKETLEETMPDLQIR